MRRDGRYVGDTCPCVKGPAQWSAGWTKAVADVGLRKMVELLVGSGVFYHLYNQVRKRAHIT